jgi:hypothetical protein
MKPIPQLFIALAALLLGGCLCGPPSVPAPEKIDQNLRWFWSNGDSAQDSELADGAEKLSIAGDADTRTEVLRGQMQNRLEKADLTGVGLQDSNAPADARGLLLLKTFPCTLSKLEQVLIALDQKSQYTGVYDDYSRTYTSDADAFTAGTTNTVTWEVDVKASLPVNDSYASRLKGGVRRVPAKAGPPGLGPFLVVRTWLTAPAVFSAGSGSYFKQDYQIEIFSEPSPGRIFHAYGMWREIKAGGFNLTLENNEFLNIVLDNLAKWDDVTAQLCAK